MDIDKKEKLEKQKYHTIKAKIKSYILIGKDC